MKQEKTIPDILELTRDRIELQKPRKELYMHFLQECIIHIREANQREKTQMIFTVPKHVSSEPRYDPTECLMYLGKRLAKSGYRVVLENMSLYIDWNVSPTLLKQVAKIKKKHPNVPITLKVKK